MSVVEELHARLSEKLAEMEAICAEYKYEVTPRCSCDTTTAQTSRY